MRGMHRFGGRLHVGRELLALLLLLWGPAAAEGAGPPAGQAEVLIPAVSGQLGEITRELVLDDEVYADEVISSGAEGAVLLRFRDGTELSIGPSSQVTIDRYVYDPDAGTGQLAVGFLAGVFEFVSGALSPASYDLRVPTGQLSIRGTRIVIDTRTGVIAVPKGTVQVELDDGRTFTVADGQCLLAGGRVETGEACEAALAAYRAMLAQLRPPPNRGDFLLRDLLKTIRRDRQLASPN